MGNVYTGTAGADTLSETTFKGDTLIGGAGNDTYYARAGSYWVSGFPEYGIPGHTEYYRTDTVEQAGGGIDTVHYSIGIRGITVSADELAYIERIYLVNNFLGEHDIGFTLQLGNGAQTVFGSNADETIGGGAGNDTLNGGPGSDSLIGDGGADSLSGDAGSDTLDGGAGDDTLDGGAGNDTLDGGSGTNHMAGGIGNDTYHLRSNKDTVVELAGEGVDTVFASVSYTLGANLEIVALGAGAIDATGNAANNTLVAGPGNNRLAGGAGVDTASFRGGAVAGSGVNANLLTGVVSGGSGNDTLVGIENLEGSNFSDALYGNNGNNRLFGLGGNDTLSGRGGNDTLTGGDGYDVLTGGSGADHFRFPTVSSATSGSARDLITDFVSSEDRIDLAGIDANPAVAGDQAFTDAQLAYEPGTGILYANVGYDGSWEVQIVLGLAVHPETVLFADIVL